MGSLTESYQSCELWDCDNRREWLVYYISHSGHGHDMIVCSDCLAIFAQWQNNGQIFGMQVREFED